MISLTRVLPGIVLFGLTSTPLLAQPPQRPEEPAAAPLQLGPLGVRPALTLREVGFDSNVLNASGEQRDDFTATFGGRVDLEVRLGRVQAGSTGFYEYLYFRSLESERGSNSGTDGRVDLLLGRLRPYLTAGVTRSHERPNAEIDARASRVESTAGAGTSFAAFSRTTFFVGYRRATVEYGRTEEFRGVVLADRFNGASDAVDYGADFELTQLTSISVHGQRARERFDVALDREANSFRYGVTLSLHPLALISGRATVGVRAFRPLGGALKDFTGVTAAVAVAYALRDRTMLALNVDRDLHYSFADRTPYYISTGARLTLTQRLFGNVEAEVLGGLQRLAYEARPGRTGAGEERDRVRTIGGGAGYRLGDGSRLGIHVDRTTRASPVAERDYSRSRFYSTLTYGF